MKTDKIPAIGLACVALCCTLVIAITLGLLASAKQVEAAPGSTPDSTVDSTTSPSESEPELQWGYKFKEFNGSIEPAYIGDVAYKSPKSTFNVGKVKLTVSFGKSGVFHGPDEDYNVPEFEIYFADYYNPNNKLYTIREVEEQFFSEKYDIKYVKDEVNSQYYYYQYSHTEEITIPEELFSEREGFICIAIAGMNVAENKNSFEILCVASIKYQLQGTDNVVLSKPYEDPWHY